MPDISKLPFADLTSPVYLIATQNGKAVQVPYSPIGVTVSPDVSNGLIGPWIFFTNNNQANIGNMIMADTSGGSWTLTMPSNPAEGAQIMIMDRAGTWDSTPLTIDGNGHSINGGSTIILDQKSSIISFIFIENEWRFTVDSVLGA